MPTLTLEQIRGLDNALDEACTILIALRGPRPRRTVALETEFVINRLREQRAMLHRIGAASDGQTLG